MLMFQKVFFFVTISTAIKQMAFIFATFHNYVFFAYAD